MLLILEVADPSSTRLALAGVGPVPLCVARGSPRRICHVAAPPLVRRLTENVHEVAAEREAPDRDTVLLAATADIVPLGHDPVSPFGVATTIPLGSVFENATLVRPVEGFTFCTV